MKKPSIKNILVPIDFSTMSIQAIAVAKNLARRLEATIHLINVQEPVYPAMFVGGGAPVPVSPLETSEELRKSAAQRIKALGQENEVTGICDAVIGAPVFNEICGIARQIPADLIVMPTHGRTGLKHVFLGSTAERVVRHSPCPVLIARKTPARIDKILVPVDFSACSLAALKEAIAFAERTAARIIVLHAVYLDLAFTADGYAMYDLSSLIDVAQEAAQNQIRSFVRKVKFGAVKFETSLQVGVPVSEICRMADAERVDLIITATHGFTGLKHLLIGSTAEQVVRYAHQSVLVVPSHPAERVRKISRLNSRGVQRSRPLRAKAKLMPAERERLSKRFRKIDKHAFPERRKTNKFRESHQLVSSTK